MWRFHPQTDELVRLVRSGAVGERPLRPRGVRLRRHRRSRTCACRPALEGGALMDVGCYCVSALRLLCGEPVRVSRRAGDSAATASTSASPACMRFDGDVLATFDCGMDVHRHQGIQIVGSEGSIGVPAAVADAGRRRRSSSSAATSPRRSSRPSVDPYGAELDDMAAAIAERPRRRGSAATDARRPGARRSRRSTAPPPTGPRRSRCEVAAARRWCSRCWCTPTSRCPRSARSTTARCTRASPGRSAAT